MPCTSLLDKRMELATTFYEVDRRVRFYINIENLHLKFKNGSDPAMLTKLDKIVAYLDLNAKEKFKDYLRIASRNKFKQCLNGPPQDKSKIASALERISPDDERAFDEILIRGYSMPLPHDDTRLFRQARSFDFLDKNLHLAEMGSVSRHGKRLANRADRLDHFIHERCAKIRGPLREELLIYNVAQTINSKSLSRVLAKVPLKFRKLNEYSRICLAWQSAYPLVKARLEQGE